MSSIIWLLPLWEKSVIKQLFQQENQEVSVIKFQSVKKYFFQQEFQE
jgi:hypothetical protein